MKVLFQVKYNNTLVKEVPYYFDTDVDLDNVAKHYFHGIKKQILLDEVKKQFDNKICDDAVVTGIGSIYDYLSNLSLDMIDGDENE